MPVSTTSAAASAATSVHDARAAHPDEERDENRAGEGVISAKDEVVAAAERFAGLHEQPGADLLERPQHGRRIVQIHRRTPPWPTASG